ncbi:MAG: C39 family peptidase [Solirubrobacteraceae bacterium]
MARLPARISLVTGSARIDYALGHVPNAALVQSTGLLGLEPVASTIAAPVLTQKLHNDCEAAALQVLLAAAGITADQLTLQAQLPRSGPIDPIGSPPSEVWGDPAQGFVGRADGSGAAGGFGVYQTPISQLAERYGARLRDLTGSPASRLYRSLLEGHAIMAWVGLADGPYGRWRSPTGLSISVNFNEHTVVLTGIDAEGTLQVINPLTGRLERWSQTQFETMWDRLGRRALST